MLRGTEYERKMFVEQVALGTRRKKVCDEASGAFEVESGSVGVS
jgi:hypothetical protein